MKILSILSPEELKTKYPPSTKAYAFIQTIKNTTKNIFLRKDRRIVLVVGPCSIHDVESTVSYAKEFEKMSKRLEKNFFFILRFFIEKSRTHLGWKGFIYDPYLDNTNQMEDGLILARKLLLKLAEMNICCSMEFVDPLIVKYFDDLIVWGFIGARTASSQYHRQYISSLDMPVGFKNALDGNVDMAVYGAFSSKSSHSFLHMNEQGRLCQIQTSGNPYSHIVLRGSDQEANCDSLSVEQALAKLRHFHLRAQVMIDCSHGNSKKNPLKQMENFENCIDQIHDGNDAIFALMLESHLQYGNQEKPLNFGVSITDPCLDWKTTQKLLLKADAKITESFSYAL